MFKVNSRDCELISQLNLVSSVSIPYLNKATSNVFFIKVGANSESVTQRTWEIL